MVDKSYGSEFDFSYLITDERWCFIANVKRKPIQAFKRPWSDTNWKCRGFYENVTIVEDNTWYL